MPLIKVISVELEAERSQQPDASDAENRLLFQAISVIAAVEEVSEFAIGFGILIVIRVE